ncbi:Protein FAR1-RELATED SEQUENCE 12 [Linum perenne]
MHIIDVGLDHRNINLDDPVDDDVEPNFPKGIVSAFNHHRMLIALGAALLFEETAESFEWLFETLLECMRGQHPRSIFIYKFPAIVVGIRSIFPSPSTYHGLCTFHIRENASRKMVIVIHQSV